MFVYICRVALKESTGNLTLQKLHAVSKQLTIGTKVQLMPTYPEHLAVAAANQNVATGQPAVRARIDTSAHVLILFKLLCGLSLHKTKQ